MSLWIVFVLCIFAGILLSLLSGFMQNKNSPVVTEQAFLIKKENRTHMDANNLLHTEYIASFKLRGNSAVLKCAVPFKVYKQLKEEVSGLLTHQGTKFEAFEWEGFRVEK